MTTNNIDKIRLPREQDKRVKILQEDKDMMIRMYKEGKGIREIARHFEKLCTRRMVQFIIFPERRIQAYQNRDWRKYHDRKKLTEATRDIRERKRKLRG